MLQDDIVNYYIDVFDNFVKDPNGEQINIVTKLFNAGFEYFSNCNPITLKLVGTKTVGVEHKCNFMIEDNKFVGIIDLLLQDDNGDLIIIDHKSSEYPLTKGKTVKAKCAQKFEDYKKQNYLYAGAVYNEFHKYPKILAWNFFKSSDWMVLPFNKEEYDKTLQWATNTIDDIYLTTDFEARPNYFYCKNICNFRNICDKQCEDTGMVE